MKKKHAGVVNMGQQIQGFAVLLRAVVLLQPFWLEALKFVTAGYLMVTTSRTCDLMFSQIRHE